MGKRYVALIPGNRGIGRVLGTVVVKAKAVAAAAAAVVGTGRVDQGRLG